MDMKKIDAEIAELVKESGLVTEAGLKVTNERRLKIIKRRVGYLRECRRDIQTNPREGFVAEEIERLLREINVLEGRCGSGWKATPTRQSQNIAANLG